MTIDAHIRAFVEGKIRSGEWPPGHRIPYEYELVAMFGCARATVGKALSALARAGLIERRRKAGSFVARPHVEAAVLEIPDIAAVVSAQGGGYRFDLLRRQLLNADAEREFCPGGPVLRVEGVHGAADGPLAHETRLISLAAVPQAADVDFNDEPPGSWLIHHVLWSEAEHRITAVAATIEIAKALSQPRGSPCLRIDRTTWRAGTPITHVTQTFVGGRYDLVARFTPSGQ